MDKANAISAQQVTSLQKDVQGQLETLLGDLNNRISDLEGNPSKQAELIQLIEAKNDVEAALGTNSPEADKADINPVAPQAISISPQMRGLGKYETFPFYVNIDGRDDLSAVGYSKNAVSGLLALAKA